MKSLSAQKGNIVIPLLATVALIAVLSAAFFFWQTQQSQTQPTVQYSSVTPTPVPTTQNEIANWKTYSDDYYSFKYPPNWQAAQKCDSCVGQVDITNPTKTVTIGISPEQAIYGGITPPAETDSLTINVAGETYKVTEYENSYVDFTVQANGSEHHILFGTGYPAGQDNKKSLPDYKSAKNTIIVILSTFKFL